ncbi:MAG TPA: 30S ribosomal protein S2 [Candidatus Saccharimonadales bacterium]|nr:30S ribosomal protein S2 [Candidatus Saccharimonadales bacterium]
MAEVSLKELLEAGAHFGHQTRRWNPKMRQFIYGARGGVHIIDLTQTAPHLKSAAQFARGLAAEGGSILFVCTKRQGKSIVKQAAIDAGMPYVTERWLGGMLTNWRTIQTQINRLKRLEAQAESGEMAQNYNKKEVGVLMAEVAKLNHVFGGIKDLDGPAAAMYVVDAPKEHTAVLEAKKLGIPVIAIADSNADPDVMDYPIPANDDAIKSIKVITQVIAEAAAAGRAEYMAKQPDSVKSDEPAVATTSA